MRWISGVAFFCLFLPACNAAESSLKDSTPHIAITGSASEEVAPDRATIALSVVTERATAEEAAAENAKAAKAVVDEILAQGVDVKDVRTVGVFLSPFSVEERDPRGGPTPRVRKGFRAKNDLEATIKSIDDTGRIAQKLVDKGANNIQRVTFDVSDAEARLEHLRVAAIKDALHRAELLVDAIGLRLGRVLEINPEPDGAEATPQPFQARSGLAEAKTLEAIPMQPGLRKLSARVTVSWALSR
jgi:uncharacterized protein YggE